MLRIAICDDEATQRQTLSSLTEDFFHHNPNTIHQITSFSSAQELLWAVEAHGNYDLYLLDVIMPDMAGIDLGMKLRQQDPHCLIIYLTTSPEFAVDSYQVRAFHYLLKPIIPQILFPVLTQAIEELSLRENATILVKTRDTILRIPMDRIIYVELFNRAVRYYLTHDEIIDSVTLREPFHIATAPLQQKPHFVACGASFVVNLEHVSSIGKGRAILDNSSTLPLPKQSYNTLRTSWLNYWLEEDRV